MEQSTLLELNEPDKRLKFSEWYFSEKLDVSERPQFMVPRKKYFKELRDKMDVGSNIMVFAYPGQGKTVSTKHFFNSWERKDNGIKTIYINCKHASSEKKIFNAIIEQMKPVFPPVEEIAKKNDREAIAQFVKNIPKTQRYFLILDEIDVPVHNDKKIHKGEWLTVFFRAEELEMTEKGTPPDWWKGPQWNVIMITNKLAFEQSLDKNERQHIQHMGIRPYSPQDIYEILMKRVEEGIKGGVISSNLFSEKILLDIAKTTADVFESNVRTGFELLKKATKQALDKNIPVEKEHIEEATKDLEIDLMLNDLQDIPVHSRAFFFSVIIYLRNKGRLSSFKSLVEKGYAYKSFYIKDIYGIFKKFCKTNNIRQLKSITRSCQKYVADGIMMGIYHPTGVSSQKHREYEIAYDTNKIWSKIVDDSYAYYNFDISLV